MAFGGAGGDSYGTGEADGNGDFAFTLTADGTGAKIGTFYLWIIDGSGSAISDKAGPIKIDGGPPDSGCWAGIAFFEPSGPPRSLCYFFCGIARKGC